MENQLFNHELTNGAGTGTGHFFHPRTGEVCVREDLYVNGGIFLCMNGPGFSEEQRGMLANVPGIKTFGVNNGAHVFRPDLWTCVDEPRRFQESVWKDGRIEKFVPEEYLDRDISHDRSAGKVRDCSNLLVYRRNEHFEAERWLTQKTINWGNHKSRGGGRSVMLVAMRIAILLGFRRIYLVGCDFYMDEERKYFFEQDRTETAIRNNNVTYGILENFYMELVDRLAGEGVGVWNCTPGSRLEVFPRWDLAEAMALERTDVSGTTAGMYEAA